MFIEGGRRLSFLSVLFISFSVLAQEPASRDSMTQPTDIEFKIKNIDTAVVIERPPAKDIAKTTSKLNTDSLFKRARSLAFKGNRKEARALCRKILEVKPEYHDVRIFMARTYSWGKLFGKATPHLYQVLASNPNNIDAMNALIDIKLWTYEPGAAIELADRGLAIDPKNEDLLYKKAKAYEMLKEYEAAKTILKNIIAQNPENENAKRLLVHVQNMLIKNTVGLIYSYDHFSKFYTPRHLISGEYKRAFKNVTLIGRTNYAERFEQKGLQYEGDIYTRISSDFTGYVNFGYSNSLIFPKIRYGIELYNKLPRGFESSFGYRYIGFTHNKLIIYTGSLNKYIYKYWVSFRPYVTPDNTGIGRSFSLQVRRYFKTANDYLTVRVGTGVSPDFINYGTLYEQLYALKTRNLGLYFQKELKVKYIALIGCSVENQELPFNPGKYIFAYNIEAGFRYRF